MLETLSADYVRTARAKGMPERRVLWRHVMRSAFLPVMSYLGPVAANVVTGSVIVEQIFSLPGIGRFFVQGAIYRDYGLVMGRSEERRDGNECVCTLRSRLLPSHLKKKNNVVTQYCLSSFFN